ncbi:MAG TPA: PilZ domain-containing protein [Gemmataceae bacterium]|nr:PilZ domain-containing protein [Gemmataceae bacterium]
MYEDLTDFDWEAWVVPAAGIAGALVALLFGYLLLVRRRESAPRRPLPPPARNGMIQADPFVHGSASERRAEFRRKGKHVKALLASEDGRQELGWSWVVDRSATGLCLKVDQEMSVGTILSVRPMNAPENTPWMQIEIKNCRPMDIHWEIGCRFVRPPAWSLLLLFG